jgi:general stress protein YciG
MKKLLTRKDFVQWGKAGGVLTKKKQPKDYYSTIGKKGGRPKKLPAKS